MLHWLGDCQNRHLTPMIMIHVCLFNLERTMPGDLKARLSETRLNLKRFIEYKQAQH
eukprot:m.7984 g.7984  ORF g.7984 m.7984 type:complete len:57 (+) comp5348_c0_seq1:79-249(+)